MPAMLTMLAERKVALAPGVPPFSFDPEMRGKVRTLFTQKEALGPTQMIVLTARQAFIEKNRAALVDFMEDNLRLVRWSADPANRDEAIKIASRLTRQPPDRFAGWLFTQSDYYRDPDMIPNIEVLQDNIGKQQEAGFLGQPIDISNYVDLAVIKEAAARLR